RSKITLLVRLDERILAHTVERIVVEVRIQDCSGLNRNSRGGFHVFLRLEDRSVVRDGEVEGLDFGERPVQDGEVEASSLACAKRDYNSQQSSGNERSRAVHY